MDNENVMHLEYKSAVEMLRHYDTLNWQIGSILVAATIVLTGLALNKDFIQIISQPGCLAFFVTIAVPFFSFFVLLVWFLWFRRHKSLYDLRNETIHRLELKLQMYHFLRIVEADRCRGSLDPMPDDDTDMTGIKTKLTNARKAAETLSFDELFKPFYPELRLLKPSGFSLAVVLAFGIPLCQAAIFLAIRLTAICTANGCNIFSCH